MQNNESPAFPVTYQWEDRDVNQSETHFGLSKAEWFAARAPEDIPGWFMPDSKLVAPTAPLSWDKISVPEAERQTLKDWIYDPYFDLPEELAFFGEGWNKYWKALADHQLAMKAERYFLWRKHYGEKMAELYAND